MSKKLLVLVFAVLFGGYAMAYDYFDVVCESGQTLSCSTSSCQTATVSKNHNGVPVTGNLIIPEYVTYNNKTYRVTGLDNNYAFSGCDGLTSVTIPNSVTSIGTYAFSGCSGLTSVTIPNSVTAIGKYAFQNCNSLTSVTISNSVTAIGDGAFSNCSSLSVVNFNATNCTTMGISSSPVFNGCTSLATLNIGNNVTNIPQYAFEGTGWYNNKPDGILYLNGWCLGYKGTAPSGSLSITDGTKGIADNAFSSCFGLNSVVIPNSVAYIGNEAFYRCSHLTSVTIGNSVTRIGESAFYDCDELTSIIIPNSVTSIGENSFMSCNSLTSITIGNSITSIGDDAFSGTGWENNQTSGILYLGGWCLGYKDNEPTGSLSIIDGTKGIADNAFGGLNCSGLTSVIIPNSVTSIGNGAFSHCSGLTSVTIGNSVTNIGNEAFGYCSGLTSVTIPSSVTSIGNSAFYNCSGLTSVTIGSGVTSIGDNAFMECESLTSVTIPNSVTRIGDKAFFMSGLTGALTIPNSVISIGKHAFNSRGEGLTSVVIGSSVTTIGDYAFSTGHLTNLTIGESVETIGQSAFCPADKIYSNALEPPAIYSCSFADEDEYLNIPVYVPCGRVSAYSNAEYWNVFTNIQQNDDCTGIEEDNELATLNMYPNPVGNTLYINAEETISNIEIVNVMGQVVKRIEVNSDNAVCDVEDLKAGVYVVRIHAASATLSQRKFVKE